MTENKTLGQLRKRIFDTLDEYTQTDGVFVTDTNRDILISRMPDAVNSSLIRMYESLAVGTEKCKSKLIRPSILFEASELGDDGVSVRFDVTDIAVCFDFYGTGSLVFEKIDGSDSIFVECDGDGICSHKRVFVTLANCGDYTIKTEGSIDVRNLCVYENDGFFAECAIPERGYMSFQLPCDFSHFLKIEEKDTNLDCITVDKTSGFAFVPKGMLCTEKEICMQYKKMCPVITSMTRDDFVFDMSALAFEALVCLCASELCREEESAMYTRLLYKYSDLSEALYKSEYSDKYRRNGFFKARKGMR